MSEDEVNATGKARWDEPLPRKTYKDSAWEFPVKTAFVNADVPSSRSVLLEADIRRIVAEEIEKALPRITSAVMEQMEQRVRLSRGTHKE